MYAGITSVSRLQEKCFKPSVKCRMRTACHLQHRCLVLDRLALVSSRTLLEDPELAREEIRISHMSVWIDIEPSDSGDPTYLLTMQMEGVVSVIQIVDNHVHDMALVDSRDELRVRESRRPI